MDSTNKFISQAVSTPVDLNSEMPPVQRFAFGGIANPSQRTFLRAADRDYLEARQRELDAYEKERQAYNTQLTQWQNEVYNPYKSQVDAYNTALAKYNEEVYNPYAKQFEAYEKGIAEWNAGPRTSDYAGPAAPTLARQFEMAVPTEPKAFEGKAPVLPFNQDEVVKFQQEATERARTAAGNRATAINVVSNPDQFNFGSMSVANRFMAEGGPVDKDPQEMTPEDEESYGRTAQSLIKDFQGYGYTPEEIQELAQQVADAGRGGDELLAYLSPESMEFLKAHGGAGTINPVTGLPEFKGGILGAVGRAVSRVFGGRKSPAPQEAPKPQGVAQTIFGNNSPAAVRGGDADYTGPEPAPAAPQSSAADLMKQLEAANAAKAAAEAKFAADLKAQQEAAAKAQQDAIAAALKADAERRAAMVAQPVIGQQPAASPAAQTPAAPPPPPPPVVQDPRSVGSRAGTASAITAATPAAAALRAVDAAAPLPQINLRGPAASGVRAPGQPAPGMPGSRPTDQEPQQPGIEQRSIVAQPGIGAVGQIGTARQNLATPSMPMFGTDPNRVASLRAQNPNNFFGLSQPALEGYNPGTISSAPATMPLYGMQNTAAAMAANPNLSPTMLGGAQNAGVMTDRLGNRIYSPGMMPLFGYAKGGDVDLRQIMATNAETLSDEQPEETINTNPVGTAQQFLADLSSTVSPNAKSMTRAPRLTANRSGAARPKTAGMQMEELAKGDMGAMKDYTPKARDTDSAKAQLEEMVRQYQVRTRAAQNKARGLAADTFGAPTLEGPSLTKNTLAKKRFKDGGEAKKAEEVEGGDSPSASALLRRIGLAVARGVPQAVTGMVDLAALPLTASGRMKAEDVVGTTDYLTKRGLLPQPQKGLASESAELLSSMTSPGGAAKAAVVGMIGPKGVVEAARRSNLFKAKGMTVPDEQVSASEIMKMLEQQGIDTSRTWLRGKKETNNKTFPQLDQGTLEYLYRHQKRPDAIEAALRDSRMSQASEGRTLSRQPGDRSVTKFNTTGGVWLTESPALAQTYTGDKGFIIPAYAPKPDAVLDAKGEQWSDFYRKDKGWKEAFADPKVRLVEVRNIIDAGPNWTNMISPDASEEELRALLTATNLFAKKPFEKRVVNKLTGEPFEFKHGGAVKKRKAK